MLGMARVSQAPVYGVERAEAWQEEKEKEGTQNMTRVKKTTRTIWARRWTPP